MSSAGSGQPVGAVWTYTGGPGIKIPDYRAKTQDDLVKTQETVSYTHLTLPTTERV